jgi:ubiquinone/menaquinone biosynthesis C-methylase UbiE
MGTNYPSYIEEANRVLKPSGWLLIAEVRSRLDPNTAGADPDKFCEAISKLGFSLVSKVYLRFLLPFSQVDFGAVWFVAVCNHTSFSGAKIS